MLPPEDTLAKIEPHLSAIGVTRCADVTDLDRVGIPVFCAIRPQGKMIQVTNGKGLRRIDAGEIPEIEPSCRGIAALHTPGTGIVDSGAVSRALERDLRAKGVAFALGCAVVGMGRVGRRVGQIARQVPADELAGDRDPLIQVA